MDSIPSPMVIRNLTSSTLCSGIICCTMDDTDASNDHDNGCTGDEDDGSFREGFDDDHSLGDGG